MATRGFIYILVLFSLTILPNGTSAFGKRTDDSHETRGDVATGSLSAERNRFHRVSIRTSERSPEKAAERFLANHREIIDIPGDETKLITASVETVPGGSHVRMIQTYKGVPVFGAEVVISMNEANEISAVLNGTKEAISLPSISPELTAGDAIRYAKDYLQVKGKILDGKEESSLMLFETENNTYRLAYRVTMICADPMGDWEVFVDATTGTILRAEDRFAMYGRVQGEGYAYLPDPLSKARKQYGHTGYHDQNDADSDSLTAQRTRVTLDSITFDNGIYFLQGPYCTVTDIENPADPEFYTASTADGFKFTRSEDGFEAVNAYYHAATAYRYVESIGFSLTKLAQLRIDPHGFNGEDNSHYSPSGNWISFGEGGVDDAEDAEVIWHEYAHAIQFAIIPTWGGGETKALGEGFADYWAASYSRSLGNWSQTDLQHDWLFVWDGHNTFWDGRILNDQRTYPFGYLGPHDAGQIWSSALIGIWNDLGKEVTDRLVLKSQYYLGYGTTASDAARAILQADRDLYAGAHIRTLVYWLGSVKSFFDPAEEIPVITHTPPAESSSRQESFLVRATVISNAGLIPEATKLFWVRSGSDSGSTVMTPIQESSDFVAQIPGNGFQGKIEYYIAATDSNGVTTTSPQGAPQVLHSFEVMGAPSGELPLAFSLDQNFPNPFNPATTIPFSLASDSRVTLRIYDVIGREIVTIVDEDLPRGNHTRMWNGTNALGEHLSSGTYLYRLEAVSVEGSRSFTNLRKMMLLR